MKILRHYTNQNGIALMMVLWVFVLLIGLATEFAFSMKGEVNTTRNFKEDAESYHLAKAGIHLGMAEILAPARFHALHSDHGLITGIPLPSGIKAQEEATIKEKNAYRSIKRKAIPLGRGTITYTLEDENGKIPINQATRNILVKVLTTLGVKIGENRDIIADSILDWIDVDNNYRLNGAENDFYQNQNPPYFAKNGSIENLDELIKIRGVDEKLLYGTNELLGLNHFFTVYKLKAINPNTASPHVLSVIFSESQMKLIINTRKEKGFYDNSTSDYFIIRSTGRIDGSPTNHTIKTVIQKISGKNGLKLLTHYWDDNSFENIIKPEFEIN